MTLQQAMELAVQHHRAGRLADAEAIYRQVLAISPNQPDVLHLLGIVAIQAGKLPIALDLVDRAIALNPKEPTYHSNRGEALMRMGQIESAIESFRRSLDLGPVYEAWNNLGTALGQVGKLNESIDAFRASIALKPESPEAHSNLGDALKQAGRIDEAIDSIDRALSINPDLMAAHNNKGTCQRALGEYDSAIESYRRALALAPALPIIHYNLAVTLLIKGDFEQGFIEYEHRYGVPEIAASTRRFTEPRWEGEELAGRTIVLHAEQGFGDTIQFARYAPLVKERGGRVILAVQPELIKLMHGLDGIDKLVSLDESPPKFDLHAPLLSLPRIVGTTLDTIPTAPYLKVDEEAVERWRKRLMDDIAPRKIAIAWSGRAAFQDDRWRSLTLNDLAPLASIENTTFYSVQVGPAAKQLESPPQGLKVIDLSADLTDFAETAAALMQMDLLITSDTAVAHLAGALDMPVWLLASFSPDWRWLTEREDSPWYPSMRLFRQPQIGDWAEPIARIANELE